MTLDIQNISKAYGKTQALQSFSAALTPGVYGLLGPNGAGKSTLMNVITDTIAADSGKITLDGEDIVKMGSRFRERIGYMPQQQGMYDSFTGRRFLWYMAALKGMKKKTTRLRIEELLKVVNLTEQADKKIGGYSGGMKQRLLIAQALLNDPDILVLDEPTAGLDPSERIRIRNFISQISAGKIVLLATHVVSDIEFISKEIIMMKQGKLIRKASVPELLKEIDGKVCEVYMPEQKVEQAGRLGKISGLAQETEQVCVRLITDEPPEGMPCIQRSPRLEDLYIYLYN